ncbi:MAG TPA: c-type cytochrome [Thiolinea sp.]|nr:c-type cytochrome [Thiolinea sp.]
MATAQHDNYAKPMMYAGISLALILFASILDSCSSPSAEEKAAAKAAAAADAQVARKPRAQALAEAATENIKPIGTVVSVDKAAPTVVRSGEEVYQAVCIACHAAGVLNAPKLEAGAWDDRIGKGLEGLLASSINGLNAMPPRGGNPNTTDDELKSAILYMTDTAGYHLGDGAAAAPAADTAQTAQTDTAGAAAETAQAATDTAAAAQAPETPAAVLAAPEAPAAPQQTAAISINGEAVYRSVCFTCHDVGIANSPLLGDKTVWSERLAAAGIDGLYDSVLNGKGTMPAGGGNPALSPDQITAAVDFMLDNAGVAVEPQQAPEQQAVEPAPEQQATESAPAAAEPQQTTEPAPAPEQQAAEPAPAAEPAQQQVAAAPAIDGEKVYRGLCFSCHDAGIANAPKLGDKAAWEPRLAAGMETVYAYSINGLNVMPPKGGNPALSDDEVKAAVDWMVDHLK